MAAEKLLNLEIPARQRFAYLYMVTTDGTQIEHRIKRRYFPDVCYFKIQKLCKKIHARIIDPTALTLNEHQQRYQRGTASLGRIFYEMRIHFRYNL